ncbi:MAG: hypothetical protein O3C28_05160 [Proteobacteria bacterium]|nr:hypothetical protein [Pseudomonadota bacterium]
MINYANLRFDYEPYPIGIARPVFGQATYRELVENLPPIELFEYKPEKGGKYSLSQVNNPRQYNRFVDGSPPWQRFHRFIKSKEFIAGAMDSLRQHGIDLGFPGPGFAERIRLRARALKRGNPVPYFPRLKARFEFSAMPIAGGNIAPHTDHPKKIITMVIPLLRDGEWNADWGGGTSVVWPKDTSKIFNPLNTYLDFDETERLKTFEFEPNQCLFFIKTNNSWHAVWPMTGSDPNIFRNTLTINIESS